MAMFHHKDGWVVKGTAKAINDLYTLVNRKDFLEESDRLLHGCYSTAVVLMYYKDREIEKLKAEIERLKDKKIEKY